MLFHCDSSETRISTSVLIFEKICTATAVIVALLWCAGAQASPLRGRVVFAGHLLPGVQITAHSGQTAESVTSDSSGAFQFADLADGKWQIEATMQCFESLHVEVEVTATTAPLQLEMKLLPAEKLAALSEQATPAAINTQQQLAEAKATGSNSGAAAPAPDASTPGNAPSGSKAKNTVEAKPPLAAQPHDENEQGADGFLVQGSVNNAGTSAFSTNAAFGNMRGKHDLYTGGLQMTIDNSALDAQPYVLSGASAARPSFNNSWGEAHVQGPLKIPHLMPRGPNATFGYSWSRTTSAQTLDGIVPTTEERTGNLAGLTNALGQPVTIHDPVTGSAFAGNQVSVRPEAAALLRLFPLPNITSASKLNFQAPVLNESRQDGVNVSLNGNTRRTGFFFGGFGLNQGHSDNTNLFGFLDHTNTMNTHAGIGWGNWFQHLGMYAHANYNFSRNRITQAPHFANLANISADAGISGNDQTPANWGPPALNFSSGFSSLSDGLSSNNRTRTDDLSFEVGKWGKSHSLKLGGDFRKLEFNDDGQQNPRGVFTFNGAASGSDLADFLLGVPDASSIAYGNADKYLRQTEYDAFFIDDWRLLPNLSVNIGLRWEYSAPITELFGRLVNLDITNGFSAVAPVVGNNSVGSLTSRRYPAALINADRGMIEPRVGLSWRPMSESSLIIRAGYGKYANTSVYANIVQQMTQQAPLSTSLNVQNSTACPLTLANGFVPCTATTDNSFGIDPNFRVGYAQIWKLQLQHDLPLALQVSASYLGTKGTHGAQEILPNSYAPGAVDPCPSCMVGFVYESSGGNSIRHGGELVLKRKMRSGFGATADYTFAKSLDDDAYLGGQGQSVSATTVAQNWRNPRAERSLSAFDQRHLLKLEMQYSSGMGLGGGTLLSGWRGRALKEWTLLTTLNMGSGLPETPVYPVAVPRTGFTSIVRPSLTGAPIYAHNAGTHLNAAAYTAPDQGQWGNAGRYSIAGPGQFSFDSSLARTFRLPRNISLDMKVISINALNKVSYTSWNSSMTDLQFGHPASAKAMRSMQVEMNLRFGR
jgi:hypothetical protein